MTSWFQVVQETIFYADPSDYDTLEKYLDALYNKFEERFIDLTINNLIENWEILHESDELF